MAIVSEIEGSLAKRDSELRMLGIYARYSEIFSQYIRLFDEDPSNSEPLKRAAFLAWYEMTEPPCFSGVGDLPADAREVVGLRLEPFCDSLDSEFRWMLSYYNEIDSCLLDCLNSDAEVASIVVASDPEGWATEANVQSRMDGRGLMGEYWLSVFAGFAA